VKTKGIRANRSTKLGPHLWDVALTEEEIELFKQLAPQGLAHTIRSEYYVALAFKREMHVQIPGGMVTIHD
jgi:hypothetical protein